MSLSARSQRAHDLLSDPAASEIRVSALGGVAVELLSPSARPGGAWARALADIDLATVAKDRRKLDELAHRHGFIADEPFNQTNGEFRMRYYDTDDTHLDVFVDEMRLCHVISWRKSLAAGAATLPVPLLLLTKLQIVKAEGKDLSDLGALLTDQWAEISEQGKQIETLVSNDWGLWWTSQLTLKTLTESTVDSTVSMRAAELLQRWKAFKLSTTARLRGRIGERVRWYEEPEEV
jgi:hypothetical protein